MVFQAGFWSLQQGQSWQQAQQGEHPLHSTPHPARHSKYHLNLSRALVLHEHKAALQLGWMQEAPDSGNGFFAHTSGSSGGAKAAPQPGTGIAQVGRKDRAAPGGERILLSLFFVSEDTAKSPGTFLKVWEIGQWQLPPTQLCLAAFQTRNDKKTLFIPVF